MRGMLKEMPLRGTHWNTRVMAECSGVHHSQVGRIWKAHGLKPHRVRHFKLSTDPEFVEKLRDVVGLYVDPPEWAGVFTFDEKNQIQALDQTQPSLPLKKGRYGTMTHDYKRHGTTTQFVALDVATGEVIHQCLPRHRHQVFLRFMRTTEKQIDPGLDLHVIFDNYAMPKDAKVKAWLAKHPRVHFHFVPTSASWLNLVERFFPELTQRQLKRLAVNSIWELVDTITAYNEGRDRAPTPFAWTVTVKNILAKFGRASDTLAALHQVEDLGVLTGAGQELFVHFHWVSGNGRTLEEVQEGHRVRSSYMPVQDNARTFFRCWRRSLSPAVLSRSTTWRPPYRDVSMHSTSPI